MEPKTLLDRTSEHYDLHFKAFAGIHITVGDLPSAKAVLSHDQLVLKPKARTCADCGQMNASRTVTYQLKNQRKETYWLKKCDACGEKTEIKHPLRPEL
jgi:hypothetical protein